MRFAALALVVLTLGPSVWADEYSQPPLVPAPGENEAPPAPVAEQPVVTPRVGQISNRPLDPMATEEKVEPPGRMKRVGLSIAFGAVSGAALGLVGGLIGASIGPGQLQPMGNAWSMASLGFVIGAPIGVLISGALFDGNGVWWATLLGNLAGAAVGLAAVGFGGAEGGAAFFSLPLVGSVLGYEMTSDASRSSAAATVTPTVSVLHGGGGAVGLMGQF